MAIIFNVADVEHKIAHPQKVKNWIKNVILEEKKVLGDITVVWCSDEYILSVNKQYLHHDYFTDIITFDYSEFPIISGDLVISIDTVASNAKIYGVVFHVEQLRVLVHGVLHLCGYKDKSDSESELMKSKEDYYLAKYEV